MLFHFLCLQQSIALKIDVVSATILVVKPSGWLQFTLNLHGNLYCRSNNCFHPDFSYYLHLYYILSSIAVGSSYLIH
ncbi:hypothetical protein EJD97_014422, partial [Solanum chilense]